MCLSCINYTGLISFCDSIQHKHFLKHCAASLVDTSFSTSPSSSSSLHIVSLFVESPTMTAEISSSDIFSEVGSSFPRYFFLFEFTINHSCLYITHAAETNQARNTLGNKTIEPIRYQMNASEYFCLVAVANFEKRTE